MQGDGWPCMCPKFVGCESKSPRDGWEMAGWLALAISKDFGVSLKRQDMAGEWLGGWPWLCPRIAGGVCVCKDMAGRWAQPFPMNYRYHGDCWNLSCQFQGTANVNIDRREMAGIWIGGCPWRCPMIACVILDPLRDGWELIGWLARDNANYVGVLVNRQEVTGRWLGSWHWQCLRNSRCKSSSPRDDWEMAGWLPLAVSKGFGCSLGWLRDGWRACPGHFKQFRVYG